MLNHIVVDVKIMPKSINNFTENDLLSMLLDGLDQLAIVFSKGQINRIVEYIYLMLRWNRVYNLTSLNSPRDILVRHIFDSLAAVKYVTGSEVLDFGSGAGLPGIPLAIALPRCRFYLLDSSSKKTIFLTHLKITLGMENVVVLHQRIEELTPENKFTCVISRATTAIPRLWIMVENVLERGGQLLAMKGKYPQEELQNIKNPFEIERIMVPYLNEERHLVKILA